MNYQEIKNTESKTLIRMAWLLEIIFCSAGFFIAFTLSTSHLEVINVQTVASPDILIGLFVLVAVALVELSKIPLVNAFLLSKTLSTKIISGTFLFLICILTFETMTTGLEQNFTNREKPINESRLVVTGLNEQIDSLVREIDDMESITIDEINSSYKENLADSLAPIDAQIKDYRKRELQLSSSKESSQVVEYKRQIQALELTRSEEFDNFKTSLERLDKELLKLNEDEQKEISESIFKNKILQRYEERRRAIKEKEKLLLSNHKQFDEKNKNKIIKLNQELSQLTKPSDYSLSEKAIISAKILKLQTEKEALINSSKLAQDRELTDARNIKKLIDQKKIAKNKVEIDLLHARSELALASENSFIHRIAVRANEEIKSPADVTAEQAGTITLFFILSIAAVAALAGPLLAFSSMNLKIENPKKKASILRSFRKMIISLRKKIMQPKIITEIQEIEKEVEKIVEVEIEIEKKIYETVEVPTVIEIEKKVYQTVEVPTPYEVQKFISVPVPTELKDLPFANNVSSINDKKVYLGGVK